MARITVEDCLEKVDNRFGLIHLAAKRVRQLRKGEEPLVVCKNKDIVTSLREIAAGKVLQVKHEHEHHSIEDREGVASDLVPEKSDEESLSQDQADQEPGPEK
ncbi:MAG: DNA-directed RNA polymerase subunit omega [Desulfobacteraceae bacterium]|nr:DNA-directed RNA polymerase subunit omega [Desulfobacteraceae bacterium]